MICLGLDTSTDISSIALADDSRLLGEYDFAHKMDLSRRLMVNITKLLQDCGIRIRDLRGIGVSVGPGSFTGLRIGVVTAKTLAQVLDIPIAGIVSLDLLAHQFAHLPEALVCPIIKVRKGEVYHAFYKASRGTLDRLSEYGASPVADLIRQVGETFSSSPFFVCGDGVPDALVSLQEAFRDQVIAAPPWLAYPKAGMTARLAADRIASGQADDALSVVPLYIRPSAPEMRMLCPPIDGSP